MILIIDDEPDLLLLTSTMLSISGHDSLTCGSSAEGLQMLRDDPSIDRLVLDLQMPTPSGIEVLQTMSAEGLTDRVRVVVSSAHTDDLNRQRALSAGASAFITKPFDAGDLVAALALD